MKPLERRSQLLISLILAFGLWLAYAVPAPADEPLQGSVEEEAPPPSPEPMPMPVPKARKPLEGKLEQSALQGGAQGTALNGSAQGMTLNGGAQGTTLNGGAETNGWGGNAQQGQMDQSQRGPLQGAASQAPLAGSIVDDPDAADQELLIDWDRWRNALMQAIQAGTLVKINVQNEINFVFDPRSQMMQSRYPNGTSAWYSCDVLPNRRIINIRLTGSSRFPSYDQAVLQAINDLQGSPGLTYPKGSRRRIVNQEASVKTAGQTQSQNYQFGDVERQRR